MCRVIADAARGLAHLHAMTGDDGAARVAFAFRTLLAREPDATERRVLIGGYNKRLDYYRRNPAAAKHLITQGESKPDAKADPIELAALTTVVMNIMNLDETINRE